MTIMMVKVMVTMMMFMSKMMMMMTLGGAVCPVRNKTDNSCYREKTSERRLCQQELSARRLWACPLWDTEDAAHADAHACGAACPSRERGCPLRRGGTL